MDRKILVPRSKNFMWTLNNYTDQEVAEIKLIDTKYNTFGYEVGESGTPHLQGATVFKSLKTIKQVINLFPKRVSNIQVMIHPNEAIAYCHKDEGYYEQGDPPKSSQEKGETEKARWKRNKELAQANKIGKESDWDLIYGYYAEQECPCDYDCPCSYDQYCKECAYQCQ